MLSYLCPIYHTASLLPNPSPHKSTIDPSHYSDKCNLSSNDQILQMRVWMLIDLAFTNQRRKSFLMARLLCVMYLRCGGLEVCVSLLPAWLNTITQSVQIHPAVIELLVCRRRLIFGNYVYFLSQSWTKKINISLTPVC